MRTSIAIAAVIGEDFGASNRRHRDSGRKFDVKSISPDLFRVYTRLEDEFGEQYALHVVFTVVTAIELHRAWNLSLLTIQNLQQLKEKFDLRITWTLGVTDLTFRFEDGLYELHRRVQYDYDSEFQTKYMKTAVALVEGHIGVHDALLYQSGLKDGKYTCPNNLFLRSNPGRLILYPFQAATCSMIFFGGDWLDAGVSALCGIVAGLIEWALSSKRCFSNVNETKLLIDFLVGLSTGLIGGLCFEHVSNSGDFCLEAIFLGPLYWFFYGTAFVIGLLEILCGELQTGVTRFLAVAVKTFVLSIGSAIGLTLVLRGEAYTSWRTSNESDACHSYLDDGWSKYILYLLCSVSVLGQYRFTLLDYWAGLIVQLVAYLAQQRVQKMCNYTFALDGMDGVFANIAGAAATVASACLLASVVDSLRYESKIDCIDGNKEGYKLSTCEKLTKNTYKVIVRVGNCLGLGRGLNRRSSKVLAKLEEQSKVQGKSRAEIKLNVDEESTLVEATIETQEFNIWALVMPAVYQLVPGSKLAMYWYNIIFPPAPLQNINTSTTVLVNFNDFNETEDLSEMVEESPNITAAVDSAEYSLWLTSLSLALGLILGLAAVRLISHAILILSSPFRYKSKSDDEIDEMEGTFLRRSQRQCFTHVSPDHDPVQRIDLSTEFERKWGSGLRNRKNGAFGA